jgi:hypothetical protein
MEPDATASHGTLSLLVETKTLLGTLPIGGPRMRPEIVIVIGELAGMIAPGDVLPVGDVSF